MTLYSTCGDAGGVFNNDLSSVAPSFSFRILFLLPIEFHVGHEKNQICPLILLNFIFGSKCFYFEI
jgi:hypothetical protein